MPYIKQEQRAQVDAQIKELANSILNTIGDDKTQCAGVLNYQLQNFYLKFILWIK